MNLLDNHFKILLDKSLSKDIVYLLPDNFYIHQIDCIEETKNGYDYTFKLYPMFINKGT